MDFFKSGHIYQHVIGGQYKLLRYRDNECWDIMNTKSKNEYKCIMMREKYWTLISPLEVPEEYV